jgi:hypothetical protein
MNFICQVWDKDQDIYLENTVMSLKALRGEISGSTNHLLEFHGLN